MKKLINLCVISGSLLLGFSCKEYLDVQPTVNVSEEQLFDNLSGLEVVLNGIYRSMLTDPNGMNAGIAGMQIYNLTASPDLWVREIGNGFYFSSIFLSVRTESAGTFANQTWGYHYRLINNCNIILSEVDNFSGQPELAASVKGQTLAIRGYAYFNLVRYFQQTYSIASDEPGVPIYLDRATPDREQNDRALVSDVYARILEDLNGALVELENWSRPGIEFINKDVVNGILAQVYMTMENWSEAASHANAARNGYTLMTPEQYQSGFDEANDEWIWGFRQTENDNIQTTNLFSRWNINDHRPAGTVFGAETLRVNESFVDLFDDTDARNQFWFKSAGEINSGWASDKFRDDGSNFLGDMIVMRAAEMLLIEAEALARQDGNEAQALALLNELQNTRLVENPTNTTDQAALLEAIWIEKRKDLYSEGLVFWDLLRNQLDLVKAGDARDPVNIPARSYRFIMQIPDDEMNFGGISVQNPLDEIF